MYKKAEAPISAQQGPDGSYFQLFNPVSPLTGGNDRIPDFMASMFPDSPKTAWMVSKIGATGLLAAGIFGATRFLQYRDRINNISKKDNPTAGFKSQLGTTFEQPLTPEEDQDIVRQREKQAKKQERQQKKQERQENRQKKKQERPEKKLNKKAGETTENPAAMKVDAPGYFNMVDNTLNTLIPASAFVLAAAAAWKGVDTWAAKNRNAQLDKAIAGKNNAIKQLMKTRARLAKGVASDQEVEEALQRAVDNDNFVKTAEDHPVARTFITAPGLLAAALMMTTTIGSYKYFSASDLDNIKYKATRAGLNTYAKSKTGATPISTIPTDAVQYFKDIDGEPAEETARTAPEMNQRSTPISVTL